MQWLNSLRTRVHSLKRSIRRFSARSSALSVIVALASRCTRSSRARVVLSVAKTSAAAVWSVSRSNKVVYTQFGGADLDETERLALDACAERAKEPCRILIRNFAPADEPETKPEGFN